MHKEMTSKMVKISNRISQILFLILAIVSLFWVCGLSFGADEQEAPPLIAIADFDGSDANIARAITQTFTVDLASSPKVRLVERARMEAAREEIGLGASGLIDPETAPQLGREVGADKVIVGSFAFIGSVIQVSARMVDVETNAIVGGVAANVTGDIAGTRSDVFGLAHQLASRFHRALTKEDLPTLTTGELPPQTQQAAQRIDPEIAGAFEQIASGIDPLRQIKNSPFKVSVDVDRGYGATYKFGEHLTVTFSTKSDCYLQLYNIDSQRQVSQLYPNRWEPSALIKAGDVHTFPPKGARWKLSLEGASGEEIILAIATKEPTNFKEAEGAQEFIGKSVVPRLTEQDKATWATSEVRFYTEEPKGPEAGKYVYIPYPPYAKTVKGTDLQGKAVGDTPYSLYERAGEEHLLGHLDEARRLLTRALALDEIFLAARIALASVHFDLGREAESKGRDVLALEHYQKAASEFERAATDLPQDPELHFSCGAAYAAICLLHAQKGRLRAADEAGSKALDSLDTCLSVCDEGELAERARSLSELVDAHVYILLPDRPPIAERAFMPCPPYARTPQGKDITGRQVEQAAYALYQQAAKAYRRHEWERAKALLEKAGQEQPKFVAARMALGSALFQLGARARRRGELEAALGYYGGAASDFEVVLRDLAEDPEAHFNCATAYVAICLLHALKDDRKAAGEPALKATQLLDKFLSMSPSGELAERARSLMAIVYPYIPLPSPIVRLEPSAHCPRG